MSEARTGMTLKITPKQQDFIEADAFEVLFGGAAGGGKSYGQLVDALQYAIQYAGSKQLILRRTYGELESSLIRVSREMYPQEICRYNRTGHLWTLKNGSLIEFGHCQYEADTTRYQSAEYDVIRFDELTHFTEEIYTYLISRVRGANAFPKRVKSSTNPGGVGHTWVKERFIDPAPPYAVNETETGSRVFIPSLLDDNKFLMAADPEYAKRLENLPEHQYKALRYGEWNLFEGLFFPEWEPDVHTCAPFPIPGHWRRFRVLDYGMDMLAAYWIALDEAGYGYVYREVYEPGLIISNAAGRLREESAGEQIDMTIAPFDLWNRRQETGKSAADIFAENGVPLVRSDNSQYSRISGWMAVREWLKVSEGEGGEPRAKLVIFNTCRNLIRTLTSLQCDPRNSNDAAREPHELTHAPDAIRYFCKSWTLPADPVAEPRDPDEPPEYDMQIAGFLAFGT